MWKCARRAAGESSFFLHCGQMKPSTLLEEDSCSSRPDHSGRNRVNHRCGATASPFPSPAAAALSAVMVLKSSVGPVTTMESGSNKTRVGGLGTSDDSPLNERFSFNGMTSRDAHIGEVGSVSTMRSTRKAYVVRVRADPTETWDNQSTCGHVH